jgi:cobalt-precorrin 5A hydrolase
MNLAGIAFTENGYELAKSIVAPFGGEAERCNQPHSLSEWTKLHFFHADALLFVGAVGIAVRAIAPYVKSKTTDPAVLVMDEAGRFVIPILSGHLGGANQLARKISSLCNAVPVLTTATDGRGVFAVDEWAKHQNCAIVYPERIKNVSSAILRGETISVFSSWHISGSIPDQIVCSQDSDSCMVQLTLRKEKTDALVLVPRILTIGIGCRRGTTSEILESVFEKFKQKIGIYEQAIAAAATIAIKQNETGLLEFCAAHNWDLYLASAQELECVQGIFTSSDFVQKVTGVDNVCERSAVSASGGTVIQKKFASDGVTLALACAHYEPDWRWLDE